MTLKKGVVWAAGIILLTSCTGLAVNINGIEMDFVNVVNPGNTANYDGYGQVNYNYGIGSKEVSIEQFMAYRTLSGVGSGNEDYWIALGSNGPASRISWHEAARFCNYLTTGDADAGAYTISGGFVTAVDRAAALTQYGIVYALPTEDEWYKAAYYNGTIYTPYANGTGILPTNGVEAVYGGAGSPEVVDEFPLEINNGTYNMMGNVWEWTESAFDGTLDNIGEDIAFRGGAYNASSDFLNLTDRSSDDPALQHQAIGMRVVVIPEPGTISLMGLSTLSLLITRSVRRRRSMGRSLLPIGREHLCDTYCTLEELQEAASSERAADPDALSMATELVAAKIMTVWSKFYAAYKGIDRKFWDYMVTSHECRKSRRKALKAKAKRRALNTLDAFLARIMK